MRRRAIFVDQDGTLCEAGVTDPARVRLRPGAGAAVRRLNADGWQVVVLCECPAIALGTLDEAALADFHERLRGLLLEENARIDGIYHCPHHPEGEVERYRRACDCRRPGSGLFDRARDEMGIDLGRSFLLADSEAALRSAVAAGVQPILVRAGTIDEAVNLALSRNTPSEATTR